MKKKIALTLMIVTITVQWQGCTKPEETGTIYGTVTDFDTGEPVKNANVTLIPSGETTLTGSDGTYMFQDLKKGDYSLSLSKAGYKDLVDDYLIQLAVGKSVRRDVQMKIKSLRITDMNGEDTNELDFGSEGDDVSRIFNIFNDSGETISWEIITTANWIESPETGTSGTLQAGGNKGVVVKIERSKLQQGDNTTTMHITSNNGNQQLTIKARRADVSTLDATDVSGNSAVLNGKINGNVTYSEKGFLYGTNHNLSSQATVPGNGTGTFSKQITGLSGNKIYYYKAYCVSNGTTLYGDEKSFQTSSEYPMCIGCGPGGTDLEVYTYDSPSSTWGEETYTPPGAVNTSDGMANMQVILGINPTLMDYPAFKSCHDIGEEWYLPSKNELISMAGHNMLTADWYWCSTEEAGYGQYAYKVSSSGTVLGSFKSIYYSVRCVRKVNP